jgi:DNA adenine methylase
VIAKPFIKSAGGKTRLLPELLARIPSDFGTYYEPFVGGGALFFAVEAKFGSARRYTIGDTNKDLITAYREIRDGHSELLRRLRYMAKRDNAKFYARVRAFDPDTLPTYLPGASSARAARFIYLNKTCFNGLHRVNRSGQFNVPYGKYVRPNICDEDNILACVSALASVVIHEKPFTQTVLAAVEGDFVYFDPPYYPLHSGSFTRYHHSGFGHAMHVMLRDLALTLKRRGVRVLLSNSDTPEVRELYKGFKIEQIMAARSINAKGDGRGKIAELLIS